MNMSYPSLKRVAIMLGALSVVILVGSGYLFWKYGWLHIQAAFADEQTEIFDEMRVRALESRSATDIANALRYVVW
jgi:hypothetical protein